MQDMAQTLLSPFAKEVWVCCRFLSSQINVFMGTMDLQNRELGVAQY